MADTQANPHSPVSISILMRQLLAEATEGRSISLGHILELFGRRGFAFLILILAMLNNLIFMVPLISIIFGLPIVFLSVQMVLGRPAPLFPQFMLKREIRRQAFVTGLEKAIYWIEKIELYVKPRQLFLTNRYFYRVHGVLALIMAMLVTLPIPVFNSLPSTALALLSIGMLQRDGIFVLGSYIVGAGSILLFKSIGSHLLHTLAL